jgi:dihydrodipicolinate synthase/N-acetylneuraminate lyase
LINPDRLRRLQQGLVIPACPLALNAQRSLDERRQRGLLRYYSAAGAGGVAVGVHTTQFAIRDPAIGLFKPVLELAADELRHHPGLIRIAGVCGKREEAIREAALVREAGYEAALLSLGALKEETEAQLIEHCRAIAEIIPLIGFYLQPAAGGRPLAYTFWRAFAEIENLIAIKIAPFNRYQTINLVRAVAESGRSDIALYTGNDDNIILDLLTPFTFKVGAKLVERRIVGGLLGQWAVWTNKAVALLNECHRLTASAANIPPETLKLNIDLTDANAVIFDAANGFAGCIPGIHEVLRRQGLFQGTWCLDPDEELSAGQAKEITRIYEAYPHLNDDQFVQEHLQEWVVP